MAKKIASQIKLQVKAGDANPSSVGSALGPHGINIMQFCKAFNEQSTAKYEKGMVVPAVIDVYSDRSFAFIIKTPPTAVLIKKILGLDKASGEPGKTIVSTITQAQMREIAELKRADLSAGDMGAAVRSIAGTARSMGITAEEERSDGV